MAKNLLDITQEILTVMTSDEVNSITDTGEAEAVARIVMSTFDALVSNRNWPHLRRLIKLESLSDNTKPTHCRLPDDCKELLTLNYNKEKTGDTRLYYEPVKWMEQDQFLMRTNSRNSIASDVMVVTDPTGIKLLIETDCHPQYYTSFDDQTIVFDSYDSEFDDTIHPSNFQAWGYVMPDAEFSDTWEPDLPKEAIKQLIEEAKATASFQLDSVVNVKAEKESAKQGRWLARKAWSVNGGIKYPNYGRKRNGRKIDPTFRQGR